MKKRFCRRCGEIYGQPAGVDTTTREAEHGAWCTPRLARLVIVQQVTIGIAEPEPAKRQHQREDWTLLRVELANGEALLTWGTVVFLLFEEDDYTRDEYGELLALKQ